MDAPPLQAVFDIVILYVIAKVMNRHFFNSKYLLAVPFLLLYSTLALAGLSELIRSEAKSYLSSFMQEGEWAARGPILNIKAYLRNGLNENILIFANQAELDEFFDDIDEDEVGGLKEIRDFFSSMNLLDFASYIEDAELLKLVAQIFPRAQVHPQIAQARIAALAMRERREEIALNDDDDDELAEAIRLSLEAFESSSSFSST